MRNKKALKTFVFSACTALLMTLPTAAAQASSFKVEEGVAGIAVPLEAMDSTKEEIITEIYNTNIRSPLADRGVSKATNYVNIRKDANTESEIVGKLYRGCAVYILERLEGDWVKIKSGDVEGFIASNYLATGKEAEEMAEEYATKYATVRLTETLRVREEQSTESRTLELIPLGETFIVVKEYEEWAEILIGTDEANDREITGFVHKDYVEIEIDFKEAISVEEELRIQREQEEAERAEAERRQKLLEEEARRKEQEAARKRAEEEAKKKNAENAKKETGDKKTETPVANVNESANVTELRNDIITYAKKFVGYPYVWGGTSLTGGADCSGFVMRIYKDFGYNNIPRTSAQQAKGAGKAVSLSDRKPGDLLFYGTRSGTVNHVAMYIGNNQIVHAANSREGIRISKYNYREVLSIRRVVY